MYNLKVESHFDSAHRLPDHPGKCRRLHGHRWKVIASLTVPDSCLSGTTGMVLDFGDFKKALRSITEELDHRCLNDFLKLPTAENLAWWIWERVASALGNMHPHLPIEAGLSILIDESPGCRVTYSKGGSW